MFRFFCSLNEIAEKQIQLHGENARHIHVVRGKAGDSITVCDGAGTDYACVIAEVCKKVVLLDIVDKCPALGEPALKITLFQALPKSDKMDQLIQKSVELGVHAIVPVQTAFAITKVSGKAEAKATRWQKIAESAAKQCGRGIIPCVHNPVAFAEAITMSQTLDRTFAAYEKEKSLMLSAALSETNDAGMRIGILIGPEGGFSDNEAAVFARHNIPAVSLGRRILRTETAGFAAILTCLIVNKEL